MKNEKNINNSLFDIIALFLSFILCFFRGFYIFFRKEGKIKNNIFFNFLDFMFRGWPNYFWRSPSLFKVTSFFSDIFNFLLNKRISEKLEIIRK